MLPVAAVYAEAKTTLAFDINDLLSVQLKEVTIPAGQTVAFDVGKSAHYHLIVKSDDITVTFNNVDYPAQNGVVDVYLNRNAMSIQFDITNHSDQDLNLNLKFSRHNGHKDLPIVLNEIADFVVDQTAIHCNNMAPGTFYTWTAPADGMLEMKITAVESSFSDLTPGIVINETYVYKNKAVSHQVNAGDVLDLQIYALTSGNIAPDAKIRISAKFIPEGEDPEDSVLDVYEDVNPEAWYVEPLEFMVESGYMNGMSDTEMAPNGTLTRAQWAKILYGVAGEPNVNNMVEPFDDVSQGQWFYNAVVWAYNEGIVNGIDKDTFGHNSNITREQMATMLFRFAKAEKASGNLNAFTDKGKVSSYAVDALIWATQNGIVNGLTATELAPGGTATRAQAAKILYVYLSMEN